MARAASSTDVLSLAAPAASPRSLSFGSPQKRKAHERTNFGSDQRGAVMVTGLFMAAVLIGALWYVMGIGDAMIFRDRMQEAADHSAYSSAALHAKGMNFICAMNIIMLVLVAVHIVLGIIHDFALAVCILSGVGCPAWIGARKAYTGYEKLFKPAITGFHFLSLAAGYGYPYLGAVKGFQTGAKYGNQGRAGDVWIPAVSPSMIPGFLSDATFGRPRAMPAKTGLPVVAKSQDYLCGKLAGMIFDWAEKFANLPGLGLVGKVIAKITCIFGCETVEDIVRKLGTAAIKFRFCNSLGSSKNGEEANDPAVKAAFKQLTRGEDKVREQDDEYNKNRPEGEPARDLRPLVRKGTGPIASLPGPLSGSPRWNSILDPGFDRGWGQAGPYVVAPGAANGKDAMMVWAINIAPKYLDTNEKKVKIASRQARDHTHASKGPAGLVGAYYAQAEFYFDCEEKWSDDECNQGDNAMFAIKWRARMHRVEMFNFGAFFADFALDAIMNSEAYQDARRSITNAPIFEELSTGVLGSIAVGVLRGEVGRLIGQMEGSARTGIIDAAGSFTPPGIAGSYH